MMAKPNIHGFKELDRLLQQLPHKVENRVLQAATQAGARVIGKEVRANAPVGSGKRSPASSEYGRLSKNIKVQALKSVRAKGRRGSRIFTGKAFWGMFLEFGTRHIAARPWFRPAIDRAVPSAIKKLQVALGRGIEREAKKMARLK